MIEAVAVEGCGWGWRMLMAEAVVGCVVQDG